MKTKKKHPEDAPQSDYVCPCGNTIPRIRVQALIEMGVPKEEWLCLECANKAVKRKQGIFFGYDSDAELKVVSKVYQDSVGSVFGSAEEEAPEKED